MYKLKSLGICGNYFGPIHSFLSDRHKRVVLNGQCSNLLHIKAGVPQGSILGPLLFLVYINDLPEDLTTSAKHFADDTSLFSVVHDSAASLAYPNDDLLKISRWACRWKMIFNPDASKQALEIVFFFLIQLSFFDHINEKIKKAKENELAVATFFSADNI